MRSLTRLTALSAFNYRVPGRLAGFGPINAVPLPGPAEHQPSEPLEDRIYVLLAQPASQALPGFSYARLQLPRRYRAIALSTQTLHCILYIVDELDSERLLDAPAVEEITRRFICRASYGNTDWPRFLRVSVIGRAARMSKADARTLELHGPEHFSKASKARKTFGAKQKADLAGN